MKKTVLFILGFLFVVSFLGAQFWTLDFESAAGYTTSITEFTDDGADFWIRTDGSDHGSYVVYNGVIGSYYFAGMDIDGEGATLPVFIDIDDIDISGQTNLEFRVYLAEDQSSDGLEDWDNADYLHIGYDIDNSGTYTNLLWVEGDDYLGTGYNAFPKIDTDFDGTGDGTEITDTFVQFTVSIPGTGSLIDIQIEFNLNGGDEDIALDNLQLFALGGNSLPAITNIVQTPDNDITSSTTVSVSADVTDSDGTISLVELHWGLTSGSLGTTISMSNGGSGDTYTTSSDIPAQSDGATVYYEVYAEDDIPESSISAEYNYTVNDPATTTIPYIELFATDLGDCYTYNVSGATKEWYWNSGGYAAMNGFNSGDTEEDWLIIPAINFDNYSSEVMTFDSWYNYGIANETNYLKLFYSTNYTGLGDPTSSTWTELTYTQPSSSSTWTGSGNIDLSGISGTSVYIAYKYHYEAGNYRSWGIDNISIAEVAGPSITNVVSLPANPNSSQTVSVSADVTDADGISSVELHWGTASGSLGTTISMSNGGSGDTYTTTSDIPAQSDGTTVYYEVYAVDNNTNPTTSSEFNYFVSDAVSPTTGDLFITEICGDGADGLNNDNGFMEIYNTTSNTLSLANVQVRYFNSNPGGPSYTLNLSGTIAAGAYIIITQNETVFNTTYSPTTADFYHASFWFNGGDDGVDIYLTTARAEVLDEFNDNGVTGSPFIWNDDNVFERTSTGDGALSGSWTEITTGIGTPGADNENPLPVTLTNFTAQFINDNLTILWTTQSETNNLGWNIYRGETENALENNTIFCLNNSVLIPGAGTTSEPTDYQFTDEYDVIVGQTYWYWLESIDGGGNTDTYGPATLTVPEEEPVPQLPQNTFLCSNYPNPFNPETKIEFSIKEGENGSLTIYNAKGQLLETHKYEAGEHQLKWDATQYGSGIYFYKLETQSYTETKKMIMLK